EKPGWPHRHGYCRCSNALQPVCVYHYRCSTGGCVGIADRRAKKTNPHVQGWSSCFCMIARGFCRLSRRFFLLGCGLWLGVSLQKPPTTTNNDLQGCWSSKRKGTRCRHRQLGARSVRIAVRRGVNHLTPRIMRRFALPVSTMLLSIFDGCSSTILILPSCSIPPSPTICIGW